MTRSAGRVTLVILLLHSEASVLNMISNAFFITLPLPFVMSLPTLHVYRNNKQQRQQWQQQHGRSLLPLVERQQSWSLLDQWQSKDGNDRQEHCNHAALISRPSAASASASTTRTKQVHHQPQHSLIETDRNTFLTHVSLCFGVATMISSYQDYYDSQINNTKFHHQIQQQQQQDDDDFNNNNNSSNQRFDLLSYNEIMHRHRINHVSRWKQLYQQSLITTRRSRKSRNKLHDLQELVLTKRKDKYGSSSTSTITTTITNDSKQQDNIQTSINIICQCIEQLYQCKSHALNYSWDQLCTCLKQSLFQQDLEIACTTLFYASPSSSSSCGSSSSSGGSAHGGSSGGCKDSITAMKENDYERQMIIGFDWGSCGWRHCGALADAQEAIAELYNSSGMLEPFECLFIIDVIERSLRDILAITIPPGDLQSSYKTTISTTTRKQMNKLLQKRPYIPYKKRMVASELNDNFWNSHDYNGSNYNNDETYPKNTEEGMLRYDSIDYISVLSRLRNDLTKH